MPCGHRYPVAVACKGRFDRQRRKRAQSGYPDAAKAKNGRRSGIVNRFSQRRHWPFLEEQGLERQSARREPQSLPKRQQIARIKVLSGDRLPVHLCDDRASRTMVSRSRGIGCPRLARHSHIPRTQMAGETPARNEVSRDGHEISATYRRNCLDRNRCIARLACAGASRRQSDLSHQLVRPGRARGFLSGQSDRTL